MAVYNVYTKDINEAKSAAVKTISAAGAETIAASVDADEVAIIIGDGVPEGLSNQIQTTVQELLEVSNERTGKLL